MASKVEIVNMALSRLSADRITSLDDNTKSAKEAKFRYEFVAESVMSMGSFRSTVTRATLAQSTEEPTYEFLYKYQLPVSPKCLRVLLINEQTLGSVEYSIEGEFILTNEPTLDILYIGKVTDTEKYDVYLRDCIVSQLVYEMAYTFTGQKDVAKDLRAAALDDIKDKLNLASLQGSSQDIPSDMFTGIRR